MQSPQEIKKNTGLFSGQPLKIKLILLAGITAVTSMVIRSNIFAKSPPASSSTATKPQVLTKEQRTLETNRLDKKFTDCCSNITNFNISASKTKALMAKNNHKQELKKVVLIDVREKKEQDVSMVPGALAHHDIDIKKLDKNTLYIAYCTIGYRSGKYVNKLRKAGLKAFNMEGGIYGWTFADGVVADRFHKQTHSVHVYSQDWNYLRSDYDAVD